MCNDYERHVEWCAYLEALAAAGLDHSGDAAPEQLPPADDVRVRDHAPVLVQQGNGVALAPMLWGFAPPRKGSAPVFNFRGDGRRFANSRRCLIPASAFFEFTGTGHPKSKWRFALPDRPVFGIAGLWRNEEAVPSFTMLTVRPGEDMAPFHDRQLAVLTPGDWAAWLYLTRPEAELLRPLPRGSLAISLSRGGSDAPPEQCASWRDAPPRGWRRVVKIATYNVNGINGRLPVLPRWLDQDFRSVPAQ